MKDLLEIFKEQSVVMITLIVLAYFLKSYLDKRIEGIAERNEKNLDRIADRIAEIGKTSLDLKKSLRNEERAELVAFRVAIEKWEDSLLSLLFDFSTMTPTEADINPFYKSDKELFLNVKIAVVRVSTYLRDANLEVQLMDIVNKIRNTYYPLINEAMPKIIDLQAALIPIDTKLKAFQKSGLTDLQFAPTPQDRDENLRLQTLLTQEVQNFSTNLLKEYQGIADKLVDLKEAVNKYIYRPVNEVDLDKD